jgi:hypothetical protein
MQLEGLGKSKKSSDLIRIVALHDKKVIISKTSLRRLMNEERFKDVRFCSSRL